MLKKKVAFCFACLMSGLIVGCHTRQATSEKELTRIHIVDRDGFKETISVRDRLAMYANNDFLSPQPYQKVTRTYGSNAQGKTVSKVTAYHDNGHISDYLELINGRACGIYRSWHPNGQLAIEAFVIEGIGDLGAQAQQSWVFDGMSRAWDDRGSILAEIYYDKGSLQGNALYYHNERIQRTVPYEKGMIDGQEELYNGLGKVVGTTTYRKGKKHGLALFKGSKEQPAYSEEYRDDLLIKGLYTDFSGENIAQIENGTGTKVIYKEGKLVEKQSFCNGLQQGMVRRFGKGGCLINTFIIKEEVKEGEEWIYYPLSGEGSPQPQLYLEWHRGLVHGTTRSWYPNGALESEREMCENKRHGVASAWYPDGSVMLIEEYENDLLMTGSYRKKSSMDVVSFVEKGRGTATLYDFNGRFLKKIQYDQGRPLASQ
ncbi:MAG: hypothetical protein AAF443_06610 [Chlamydiota bacterium]